MTTQRGDAAARVGVPELAGVVHGGSGYQGATVIEHSIGYLSSVPYQDIQTPQRKGGREGNKEVIYS